MITINNIRSRKNLMMAYTRLLTNPEAVYKNYFRNIYATYGMSIDDNLKNLSKKIKSGYVSEQSYKVYIPKTNGLNRMFTVMSIEDQIVYQAYANKLADQMLDKIKNRYKKCVFGNMYAGKDSDFFFQKWDDAYKAYTKAIIRAHNNGNSFIASFDLTACYDSINHNLIKKLLYVYHFSEETIKEFIMLLEKWCSPSLEYSLGVGIPQGPQASGIIAEAVLSEYDGYIETQQKKYSFKYFRYVDDIKILAKDEETVKWILFLLDKKSKELGLFPQASKVSVHKITDIDVEVKHISKPLFEDDLEEIDKPDIAANSIEDLLKKHSNDITTIRRYLKFVKPNAKNNRTLFKLLTIHPELISSFAFYVSRYPRRVPQSIIKYIVKCSLDKSRQYQAGILMRAVSFNLTDRAIIELGLVADSLLKKDRKEHFIIDLVFKEQLYLFLVLSKKKTIGTFVSMIKREPNWWIRQQFLSDLVVSEASPELIKKLVNLSLFSNYSDESLGAAMQVVVDASLVMLPNLAEIPSIVQEILRTAGIISRRKYSNSQINRYLEIITSDKWNFRWKKVLGKEHDYLERLVFAAMSYWKTDLTAFVNLWDTIDDKILSIVTTLHSELGRYSLGNVGGIKHAKVLPSILPNFYNTVMMIHDLRLQSYLSHSMVKNTGEYTGPIPFKKRNQIRKMIAEGLRELEAYL